MSFDINRAIEQGEKDAKAAERAKKRGASAGRGGRGGFSRSAGRSAVGKMKIRGRGIAAETWKNGKSFKRRIDYALDKNKSAELIFANSDLRSMRAAANLRTDIKEPVGHISMSLPPSSGKKTKEEWAAIVETAREQLGLDDTYPMIVATHRDTQCDHIHLIFSRISVTGKCHDQRNLGLKCAAVERIIEDRHSLKLVPPSEFKTKGHITKNEIEKGLRTRQLPARMQIATALKVATQGKPTVQQFVERLQSAGIGVRANVASTGKMNGFSFSFDGIEFGASKIGKEYGWKELSERIEYVEATDDREFLANLDGTTGNAGDTLANAIAITNALNTAVARVAPATADAGSNISNDPPVADRAVQRSAETRAAAPSRIAEPVQPAIRGFARTQILNPGLRSWVDGLSNRLARARVDAGKKQQPNRALLDGRDRTTAIQTADGYAIPEPRHLSDEQITSLLADLGGDKTAIEVRGNPDFCERAERVAKSAGLQVKHEYQVTAKEKQEAEARWEERQRDLDAQQSEQSAHPVPSPKP